MAASASKPNSSLLPRSRTMRPRTPVRSPSAVAPASSSMTSPGAGLDAAKSSMRVRARRTGRSRRTQAAAANGSAIMQLAPEGAAQRRRAHAHAVVRPAEQVGQLLARAEGTLRARVDHEAALGLEPRGGHLRLHVALVDPARAVAPARPRRPPGQGRLRVADAHALAPGDVVRQLLLVAARVAATGRGVRAADVRAVALDDIDTRPGRARRHRRLEIERCVQRLDVDDDLVDAVSRRGLRLGHDQRHGLPGVDDLRARQRLPGAPRGARDEGQIGRGQDRDDPRHVERRRAVDAVDAPVRLGREDQPRVEQAGDGDVGGVARRAADLALPVAASPRNADCRARRRGHGHKVLSEPRRPMVPQPAGRRRVDRPRAMPVRFAHPCARSSVTSHWAEALSPDRGLRVPLRLRGLRAGGAERQRRVDVPAALRRARRLRRDARPRRRAASGSRPSTRRCPPAGATCPGTMVLETTWGTRTGWVIVRDVLLIGPWHHDDERSHTHRRSPTDYDADHVLLRTMRCVNGRVEMHMDCEPRFDYGRKRVDVGVRRPRLRRGGRHGRGRGARADAHHRPAHRLRGRRAPARARRCATATPRSSRCRGASTAAPRPTTRPTTASSAPPTTGTSGSATASSPTTRGAPTCSAAR